MSRDRDAFVAALTEEDVHDHYEMFGIVSGIAAQRAAATLKESELKELEDIVEQMASPSIRPETLEDFNFRFHQIINRRGSSRRLSAVISQLSNTIPSGFFEFTGSWKRQAELDHQAILNALKQRDGRKAAALLVSHLHASGEFAVDLLSARGFWDRTSELGDPPPEEQG